MTNTSSLRGLTTISFWVTDVEAAEEWRAQLLGVEPYFVRPPAPAPVAYIEFRIGGDQHQLGIMAARSCARNDTRSLPSVGLAALERRNLCFPRPRRGKSSALTEFSRHRGEPAQMNIWHGDPVPLWLRSIAMRPRSPQTKIEEAANEGRFG